ncbi:MAG: response regulator [Firmicutes bacterium]|jgi:response regulator NasT|nr:response regulator [Bacillota bacterium]
MTRVLVAEDEAIVRLDLREMLTEEGYDVVGETGRGDEAIRLASELKPDLIIMDIKMPGLDGLSAAKQIQANEKLAILILTAFSQRSLIDKARDAGALAYLVKPFQKEELLPAIEVALARFREIQALEEENATLAADKRGLAEQLETRRWVDRAKGRLMDDLRLSEQDAFSFIQKTAMDRRLSMREVSREIVESGLRPNQV